MELTLFQNIFENGLFAAIAAVGFSSISNTPRRAYFLCAVIAAIGHAMRYVLISPDLFALNLIPASAMAAFTIGILGVSMAPVIKCPDEVCFFPSLLPMTPGMYAYRTIESLLKCLYCHQETEFMHYLYLFALNGFTCTFIVIVMVVGAEYPGVFIEKKAQAEKNIFSSHKIVLTLHKSITAMELRQLKYFVKAAEVLNFSEAAKMLFIAQSTLSQQIKQLEDELNVQLFQRTSHTIYLTEAGKELLPYAVRTLHDADACIDRIHDLRMLLTGTLNIGVTYSFSPILTETLLDFMKQYPNVKLNIYYKPMAELMDMLENRAVDFVLAFRSTERNNNVESHTLFDNHLAVIVSESHSLATRNNITLSDLQKFDLALPSKGLQARNTFDRLVSRSHYPLEYVLS